MFGTQSGGTLILSGLPVQEQRHLYGQVALQVSALGQAPEARNGVTRQGARLLVVSLRRPEDLARDWGEVFGIILPALCGTGTAWSCTVWRASALGVRDARADSGHFAGSY